MRSVFKTVELSVEDSTRNAFSSEVNSSKKMALILLVAIGVLIPAVAILHAVDTSGSTNTTGDHDHDDDHDHDMNHGQDHDDNETSDDNSVVHAEHDDLNDNEIETD